MTSFSDDVTSSKTATAVQVENFEPFDDKLAEATQSSSAGNVVLINEAGEVRRIPIPSDNPNDPLNYSKWRKLGILVCCCWFSIFSLVLVGGAGPVLGSWFALYAPLGKTPQQIVSLTTYPSLVMACGCFIILPLSMVFGRRPLVLVCCVLLLGSTIGAGASQNYETHMAMRILQGIAAGSTESVLPLIIADMSFVDERGLWFGVYWGVQNLINTVFTISSSYLVAETSWRYFYWVLAIFAGVGLLITFFLLAETRFERPPSSLNGQLVVTDEWGVTHVLSDAEVRARFGEQRTHDNSAATQKSYRQHLKIVDSIAPNPWQLALRSEIKLVKACSSPAVVWAILASSISLGIGIAMTLVYGTILTKGYGWSQASVGLINVGIFPASLAAIFYTGYFGDKMNIWLAKRRNGVHIPEDTLVQLIFPFFVSVIGCIIFAVCAQSPEDHSAWGIIMGWTLFEFGFIVVLMTTTHFGSEAYPGNPGPALVVVVGLKNVVSFGASQGIVPMVSKYNYITAFMILLGFFVGIFLLGIPVYLLNPRWRAAMSKRQT